MLYYLWYTIQILILVFVLGIGLLYKLGCIPTPRAYKLIQQIPGPKGVFFFGNTLELMMIPVDDIIYYATESFKKYERIMKHWFVGIAKVYLKDPKDIQELFTSVDCITKGNEYKILHPWLNEGLLTSTGEKWHHRRKILTPSFHFKILEGNMTSLNKNAELLSCKFQQLEGQEVDIEHLITLCTLDVISETTMGISLNAQSNGGEKYESDIKKLTKITVYRAVRPLLINNTIFNLFPTGREFRKSIKNLHAFTENVIRERKAKLTSNSKNAAASSSSGKVLRAFLDNMLEYEHRNPGSFTDAGIREEVDTFMFEGHDTTSSALTFIFFDLARFQDIQQRVYEEMCDIFGDSNEDMTLNDLHRMVYLEKVIKESLRLYPSVPVVTRLIEKDLVLDGGVIIPAKTDVVAAIYMVHRNPKYWHDPEKFDPERFSEDQVQGRHPYAYIPFSAGHRNCIGQKLAMMELKTIVATVVRKLKVLPVTKAEEIHVTMCLILRSKIQIKCKFVKR